MWFSTYSLNIYKLHLPVIFFKSAEFIDVLAQMAQTFYKISFFFTKNKESCWVSILLYGCNFATSMHTQFTM